MEHGNAIDMLVICGKVELHSRNCNPVVNVFVLRILRYVLFVQMPPCDSDCLCIGSYSFELIAEANDVMVERRPVR